LCGTGSHPWWLRANQPEIKAAGRLGRSGSWSLCLASPPASINHLWQGGISSKLLVQKGTYAAIFQPGHQDFNVNACVSGVKLRWNWFVAVWIYGLGGQQNLPTRPICVQSPSQGLRGQHKCECVLARVKEERFIVIPG
jgi:hypothetical protein